jgi:hypothetical protein
MARDASQWNAYVRDYQYDCGPARCSFSASGLASLSRPDLAEVRQLAASAGEDNLLASELVASARHALGTMKLGLNYQHDRDDLQRLVSNTYTAAVGFPVAAHSILQLQAGTTHADQVGTIGFAGVAFKTLL